MKGSLSISKFEDFLLYLILYLVGDSGGSSLRSLDMVDNLYLLLIRVVGSTYFILLPESLTSGELEFPLSFDLGWLFTKVILSYYIY